MSKTNCKRCKNYDMTAKWYNKRDIAIRLNTTPCSKYQDNWMWRIINRLLRVKKLLSK